MILYDNALEEKQSSPKTHTKLSDVTNQSFQVLLADTPALLDQVYALRYQVYCREHDYEAPSEHPQERETDEFDGRSVHSLLVDRASGVAIGTVRLILPDQKAPETSFPIQHICSHPVLADLLRTSTAAEVSRFAISKKIRRMADRSLHCTLVLGLMKATLQMSFQHCITDWLAVMEPALLRLLSRFSICFKPIGPLVAYHGMRQPCYINVGTLLERLRQEYFDLWKFVTESSDSDAIRSASQFGKGSGAQIGPLFATVAEFAGQIDQKSINKHGLL